MTATNGVQPRAVLVERILVLAESCRYVLSLPSDDACVQLRHVQIRNPEVEAKIESSLSDSLPAETDGGIKVLLPSYMLFPQAARAASLVSGSQHCSETRANVIVVGGGSRRVVSADVSMPRWRRIAAQVLATLREALR